MRRVLSMWYLGMGAVALSDECLFELTNPSHHRLQLQDTLAGGLPSHKRHALSIIEDHQRIHLLRLGALHARLRVVAHRFGIDDHDLRVAVMVQSQRHSEALKPGRFETDRNLPSALGQPLQQVLVRLRIDGGPSF